jgi:glycyl-tRNA synthetase
MSKPTTAPESTQLKDIVAHAKEYGFVFQSS